MEKLLEKLVSLPGACGYEQDVIRFLYERLRPLADDCVVDGVGDLIVTKKGAKSGPTLVLSAHADEVGFIVKKIEPNGLIRFEKLGGHDDRILLSEEVVIHTSAGPRRAVIGTISAHMKKFDDPDLLRKYTQMYMDAGARDADEARALGIRVGDPVTWATPYTRVGAHRAYGHGFDDRCGCALLADALEHTDFSRVNGTVVFVFSVQEEVGLRGARAAAHRVDADVAIAVDTTAVSDTPESVMDGTLALGRGAGIKILDASLIAGPGVWRKLEKLAEERGIPYQPEIFTGIGTDAGELHMSRGGVPTGVISVPSRYAHSSVEMIDLDDLKACSDLLKAFILDMKDASDYAFLGA